MGNQEDEAEEAPRAIQGTQALSRAISLLDLLASSARPLRLAELAAGTDLNKATAHRMLSAFAEARMVQYDSQTQTWRLGLRLFEMAHKVWDGLDLRAAAEPELLRLLEVTREAVRIAIPDGGEVLYIEQREAPHPLRLANGIGARAALHASSAGKAILSHLEPAARDRLIAASRLIRFTPRSITTPEALRAELVLSKARGYAVSIEEQSEGINSVAAPILDYRQQPVGAVVILGPAFRLPVPRLHALGREVMEAARRISGNAGQSFMSIEINKRPGPVQREAVQGIIPAEAYLGEAPLWSAGDARLYWVDMLAPAINVSDLATGRTESHASEELVSAVLRRRSGGFVAITQSGVKLLDRPGGRMRLLVAPEADLPGNRLNDAKCDSRGRLWAGSLAIDTAPGKGRLYRIEADGKAQTVLSGIHVSNGLGWSADDRVFYFADSGTATVWAHDFEAETGQISGRRMLFRMPADQGKPGGLATDMEGGIWVAHWDGWCVARYDAQGRLDRRITLPVPRPTSCCFGGADGRTLLVTSARIRLSGAQLAEAPLSGSVFAIPTEFRGVPVHGFAG